MKPGVAWWALQQSVSLSPIKLICPAPYDCTPPAFSFLREIALALNHANLNISSCLFFPTASQRFLDAPRPRVVQISQESHLNVGSCRVDEGGCWDSRAKASEPKTVQIRWRRKSLNVAINLADQHKIVYFYYINFGVYLVRPPDTPRFSGLLVFKPNDWWMALIWILEITVLIWDKLPGKVKSHSSFLLFFFLVHPLFLPSLTLSSFLSHAWFEAAVQFPSYVTAGNREMVKLMKAKAAG